MPSLDQNTLVYVATSVTFLAAVLLIYLKSVSTQIKGPKWWSLGNFLIGLGILLFPFNHYLGKYLTFVIGGTSVILGVLLYRAGLRRHVNKTVNFKEITVIPSINILLGTIFTLVYPSEKTRMIIYSLISIYVSVLLLIEFLKPQSKSTRKITFVGVIAAGLYGATMVVRIVGIFLFTQKHASDEIFITKILFFVIILSQVALAIVFVILFNVRLSDELKAQLANRDKFFSLISHDLNGPVRTMAEMLRIINNTELFDKDKQQKLLSELEKISNSTSHLLQNLLQWSKNQTNNIKISRRNLNLSETVKQNIILLEQCANHKSIKVNFKSEPQTECFADPMMVDTILRNLLSNAIKFTPKNGKVDIKVYQENSYAIVAIKDSGTGIAKEVLDKFYTNQPLISSFGTSGEKGSGLGLLLCRDFIKKNKGEMDINTFKNKGTEIKVKLPTEFII